MLLLYIAHIIVHAMWKRKIDPDNSSIPYLTALGDLLGSCLLAVAFLFLLSIHKDYGAGLSTLNASNWSKQKPKTPKKKNTIDFVYSFILNTFTYKLWLRRREMPNSDFATFKSLLSRECMYNIHTYLIKLP